MNASPLSVELRQALLFFGGKGGVGKTTLAAAAASGFARRGERVLLVSVDPAHSLGDLLECKLGDVAAEIAPGLFARELDPEQARRDYLQRVQASIRDFSPPELVAEAERQVELAGRHPGAAESALFEALCRIVVERDNWDRVIIDTAPTGHTLYLLALPEQMQAWTEALLLRQSNSRNTSGPAPATDNRWRHVHEILEQRRQLFSAARDCLTDAAQAGFCLVLNPDLLSRRETLRARADIESAGVAIPGVFVNRVEAEDSAALETLRSEFSGLPMMVLPRQRPAPVGVEGLDRLAAKLFS